MTKTKLYKDPNRGKTAPYKPYVPAYQIHGIEPQEIAAGQITDAQKQLTKNAPVVSYDNPRTRPAPTFQVNVPFAAPPKEPSPLGFGPFPNVGNNMENTWVSVDGEDFDNVIIDEEVIPNSAKLDINQPMIDNNYDDENNYKNIPNQVRSAPVPVDMSELSDKQEEYQANSSLKVNDDEYVLVVDNSIITIGPLELVQEEVRSLVFGEHTLNQSNNITPDDIIVLKRVKIKVGVFLE